MLALALALSLAGTADWEDNDGRGHGGPPAQAIPVLRTRPRVHLGVAAAGLLSLTPDADAGGGPGFTLQLGVAFGDTLSVYWHGSIALLASFIGSNGLHVDFSAGRWGFGAGVDFTLWTPTYLFPSVYRMQSFVGATLPLHVRYSLSERAEDQVDRSSWFVSLILAPGLQPQPYYYGYGGAPSPFAFLTMFSLGYLWH